MKKRNVPMILTGLLATSLALTACGGGTASKPASSNAGDSSKASGGADKTYTVKISYENQPGEPVDLAAKKWKELAEQKSNGKLKIELYPSSQLGSKKDVVEQGKAGSNVLQITDASFLMDIVPDIGIISAPYLADNVDDLLKLTKTDWYNGLTKDLEGKGVTVVTSNWYYGSRHIISKKPIKTPDDLKGQKIRVPGNKLFVETMKKLGATPTPMPLGEVYPAVAQGVVDGMENPLPVIWGSKVYENAKNVALTGHMDLITQFVGGQKFISTLPPEVYKVLKETGDEAGEFMTKTTKEADQKTIEDLKAKGVTVTDVDKKVFKDATKPVYTEMKEWSPGLYDKVQGLLKK